MKLKEKFGVLNKNLATRLIFWFGVLVLVPMLITTLVIDRLSRNALERETLQKLTMIAKDKANSLEIYAYERARGAAVLGRLKRSAEATLALQNPNSSPEQRAEAERSIQLLADYFAPSLGFTDAIITCPVGNILYQTNKSLDLGKNILTGPQRDSPLATLVKRTRTLLAPDLSDFALYPGHDLPLGFAAAPIIMENGHNVGLLVLQLNTREIHDIITDYAGLGRTGQIVIGTQHNDEIRVAAPLRDHPDSLFKLTLRPGADYGMGLQNAMSGNQGAGLVSSIFRNSVMASWTYVPSFRWGMSVQQDVGEAMTMVTNQRWTMLGILAAILFPSLLVALAVARSISRPIQTAVAAAERVASGDLSATLSAEGSDEISKLINALGQMVNYLNSLIGQVQRST
ncbi:MAG: methyl-accepting chemotaxis protein, partial [Methylococcaceae bacterium]|nr:methyl-accepting chemotaxis protein [Methylococcaceae bacterium]